MRNFIVLFEEKEGTSILLRLLDKFENVSVIHQTNNRGWEPFDTHSCGPMPTKSLERCLDMILSNGPIDFTQLNQIYSTTSTNELEEITESPGSVGFKMRFVPPKRPPFGSILSKFASLRFKRMMFDLLKRHDVVVLIAVRQDTLRWGLSKYHGDGTGKPGHLQFKLARGEMGRDDIGKIFVEPKQLGRILETCNRSYESKRQLTAELESAGIQTHPLFYEEFLTDKQQYFRQILSYLEQTPSQQEIDAVLSGKGEFEKVHSDDISSFVENHEEILDLYGDRFFAWP